MTRRDHYLRWITFLAACLFLMLFEWYAPMSGTPIVWVIWHVLLYGGTLVFTLVVFDRLERMQRRVAEHSASFRALFEATGLGVLMVGPNCVITEANRSAEVLTGWTRQELLGRHVCGELLFRDAAGPLGCPGLCGHAAQDSDHDGSGLVALQLRHKDGTELPVMVSSAPVSESGFAYLIWDVSERTRLEAEAVIRRRQAEGLREIGLAMAALTNLKADLGQILDRARDLFGMDLVAWGILDEPTGTIRWQAAAGTGAERFPEAALPIHSLVMGRVLGAGRPFITHNLSGQLRAQPVGRLLFGSPPLQTAMAVPLRVREDRFGVLLCASLQMQELTDEDVMLFTHLGSYLATAVENEELLEQVHHMAALEERHRLARELHDGFGQILTYVGVRNLMIRRYAEQGQTEAIVAETEQLKQVLQEAHKDVRRSIFHLKESGKPRAPLADRWRELLCDFQRRSSIDVIYEVGEKVPARLAEQAELQLTRILQEALANVRNHSGACCVTVRLAVAGDDLHLSIADNGAGFDQDAVHGPDQQHYGLSIMRERAAAVGGQLDLRSMRGHGATVTVQVPLRGKER